MVILVQRYILYVIILNFLKGFFLMLNQQQIDANYTPPKQQAGILFQPNVYEQMQRGINQVIDAIRPTLGPNPHFTGIEAFPRTKAPELLDDGGTIARRLIELPNQHENVGAMLIRAMLWRIHEQSGDGTATAAILFQAIYNEGIRYIASGGNAMLLRQHLENGLKLLMTHLKSQVIPVTNNIMLSKVARTVCDDDGLANALSEIFEIIDHNGVLDVQSGHSLEPKVSFFEGSYWKGGIHKSSTNTPNQPIEMLDPSILLTDFNIKEPEQLFPILQIAVEAGIEALVIVCRSITTKASELLKSNEVATRIRAIAVKTPGTASHDQANALADLSFLTGGTPLLEVTKQSSETVQVEDFGQARRIWTNKNYLGIKGGQGDVVKLRMHLKKLNTALAKATTVESQTIIQSRIGRLRGGLTILYVGGATQIEVDTRKNTANRAAQIIRQTTSEGVLLGGGLAFLSCRDLLKHQIAKSASPDERAAYAILYEAVQAPFNTLASNGGHEGGAILAQIDNAENGTGFDFDHNCLADFQSVGIYDSAEAQLSALQHAVKTAALALTVDAVVYRKIPEVSTLPE